jgi:hypothetical protein
LVQITPLLPEGAQPGRDFHDPFDGRRTGFAFASGERSACLCDPRMERLLQLLKLGRDLGKPPYCRDFGLM